MSYVCRVYNRAGSDTLYGELPLFLLQVLPGKLTFYEDDSGYLASHDALQKRSA